MRSIALLLAIGLLTTSAVAADTRKAICVSECAVPDSAYPLAAKIARIEGVVQFTFLIGTDGRVANCAIVAASDPRLIDNSICAAVQRRWRYKPALNGGVPVEESRTQKAGFGR